VRSISELPAGRVSSGSHAARESFAFTAGLGKGWTASLAYTTTTAKDAGYTVLGKNLGDDQVVVGIARTF